MNGAAAMSKPETVQHAARRFSADAIREGYKPVSLHTYCRPDGVAHYWKIRLKHPDGRKWLRPMRANGNSFEIGEPEPLPGGKLLYEAHDLFHIVPSTPVLVVEGEAVVDALIDAGIPAVTSGGSSSAAAADWSPLKGRVCIVWPDRDTAGMTYALAVVEALCDIAAEVRIIADEIVQSLPEGGDAVDWLREHPNADANDILALPTVAAKPQTIQPRGPEVQKWPAPIADEAFYGLAGEVVRAIEPHTEADAVALLVQFLTAFGNAIGRCAYYLVEGDRHYANAYAVMVGETSKARKGTSWGRIRALFGLLMDRWVHDRVHSGLSSGEGLIWAVRDPIMGRERTGKGADACYVEVEADPGIADKRLLVVESEFANVLRVMTREGNTLSRVIRDGWDRGDLATMTKNSPARATGAHISLVGHVTAEELRRYLDRTEAANGFANRFLYLCVKRSKVLPFGGTLGDDELQPLAQKLAATIGTAETAGQISMNAEARTIWERVYPDLSEGQPGLLGAITGRAEAHVVRLALIYALLDRAQEIQPVHLSAALAIWEYAEASARYIFGASMGDPVADEIVRFLRAGPKTRTELRDLFGRHRSATQIGRALTLLEEQGRASHQEIETGGRPAETWSLSEVSS